VIHGDNLHLLDDLMLPEVRERMRTRTAERMEPVWQKRLDALADVAERARLYIDALDIGADYEPRELEVMKAMDYYKRRHRRPHPTWREVIAVMEALGWGKPR